MRCLPSVEAQGHPPRHDGQAEVVAKVAKQLEEHDKNRCHAASGHEQADNWPLHSDTATASLEGARAVWMTYPRAWLICAGLQRALGQKLAPVLRRHIAGYLIASAKLW